MTIDTSKEAVERLRAEVTRLNGIIATLRNDMWQAMQDARTDALREASAKFADGSAPQIAILAMIEKDTDQ